jgi:hypothetical protein
LEEKKWRIFKEVSSNIKTIGTQFWLEKEKLADNSYHICRFFLPSTTQSILSIFRSIKPLTTIPPQVIIAQQIIHANMNQSTVPPAQTKPVDYSRIGSLIS